MVFGKFRFKRMLNLLGATLALCFLNSVMAIEAKTESFSFKFMAPRQVVPRAVRGGGNELHVEFLESLSMEDKANSHTLPAQPQQFHDTSNLKNLQYQILWSLFEDFSEDSSSKSGSAYFRKDLPAEDGNALSCKNHRCMATIRNLLPNTQYYVKIVACDEHFNRVSPFSAATQRVNTNVKRRNKSAVADPSISRADSLTPHATATANTATIDLITGWHGFSLRCLTGD